MNIAYILYSGAIISNRSNGIKSQAESWAEALISKGHHIEFINNWGYYEWDKYDAIHLFGGTTCELAKGLYQFNSNIHWSPIVDPVIEYPYLSTNLRRSISHFLKGRIIGIDKIETCLPYIKKISVRTQFEKNHLQRIYHLPDGKFELVPLSLSKFCQSFTPSLKEDFCLHISSIYQERKNVIRLIQAAKKYDFHLVLAGNKGTEKQFENILKTIGDAKNIEVLGFVSEEQKLDLYKRAKVFALPSLQEGVGIVALDAAFFGCDIVMTNIPGPKEYYRGKCLEVNPYDIDDIGQAIMKILNKEITFQPELSSFVGNTYSIDVIASRLIDCYNI